MIKLIKLILLPISFIYGQIVWLRNLLYNFGFFKSYIPNIKTICIGNLNLGGTGKTPHTEFISNLLYNQGFKTSVLSRGYGRTTKGFYEVSENLKAAIVGDEPLQIRLNLPKSILNFVCENRKIGIYEILKKHSETEVIVLDDALQHRSIKPGFNIVLSEYYNLFFNDYYLPTGQLRDSKSSAKRADLLIVTKCPETNFDKQLIKNNLRKYTNAEVIFSQIKYSETIQHFNGNEVIQINDLKDYKSIIFTGISNSTPFVNFLETKTNILKHLKFKDHHSYSIKDLKKIIEIYKESNENSIIITTQKDAVRLKNNAEFEFLKKIPLFYLPIEITFGQNDELLLKKIVSAYVRKD